MKRTDLPEPLPCPSDGGAAELRRSDSLKGWIVECVRAKATPHCRMQARAFGKTQLLALQNWNCRTATSEEMRLSMFLGDAMELITNAVPPSNWDPRKRAQWTHEVGSLENAYRREAR